MRNSARSLLLLVVSILLISGVRSAGAAAVICQPILLKPVLIDTNGDGPTPGTDGTITPQYCPGPHTIVIANPWQDCNGSGALHNTFLVTFDPATNQILSISRDRGDQQEVVLPTYDSSGNPDSFAMAVTKGGTTAHQGTATLIKDSAGSFTGILFGPPISLELDFVFHFGSNGQPDYMSLPWGQTGALGVKTNPGCGPASDGSTPQIWIPLVSGGGIDFDPTLPGVPPPSLMFGPAPAIQALPTLSRGMTIALAVSILVAGLLQLRRSGLGF